MKLIILGEKPKKLGIGHIPLQTYFVCGEAPTMLWMRVSAGAYSLSTRTFSGAGDFDNSVPREVEVVSIEVKLL